MGKRIDIPEIKGYCPECRRYNGHANGCPMANPLDAIIGWCDICGEPIYAGDLHVEDLTDDWEMLHTRCIDNLIDDKLVS